MKKPNLKSLKINVAETKRIRENMSLKKSVKITINIDSEILTKLRNSAAKTGVPYQRLINRTLAESLNGKSSSDSRLERLEKEIKLLKKKIAA
jgi:predicted DNA binding CopG/RHH family protein